MAGLSENAKTILAERYQRPGETPNNVFRRASFGVPEFYDLISTLRLIPNSPTLFNAGTGHGCLSACFVIPIDDTRESIAYALTAQILTLAWGGGTGFSLSRLRPKNDRISGIHAKACGPVAVLRLLNQASKMITQNGIRQGANMAILHVSHPDIEEFVQCKSQDPDSLSHFNISVAVTDRFMDDVDHDGGLNLVNPRDGVIVKTISARSLFSMICREAYKTGDPGLFFIDRANEDNPFYNAGMVIEGTNPCGEQPLLPWESCNLAHLNLSQYIASANDLKVIPQFDFKQFRIDVAVAVRYLDTVVDENQFPLPEQASMNKMTRRIGLGVMGLHDLLIKLRIPYESDAALKLSSEIAEILREETDRESLRLGAELGPYAGIGLVSNTGLKYRHAWRTTIAPTGTTGIIAGCSSGIEPWFSLAHVRRVNGGIELQEINEDFRQELLQLGRSPEEVDCAIAHLLRGDTIQDIESIPTATRELFKTAKEIAPEFHIKMQGVWQDHIDSGISKTINLPNSSTPEDVSRIYTYAHQRRCKGVTVYRDGSRAEQVLSAIQVSPMAYYNTNGRRKLPIDREAVTHKFQVGGTEGYLTVGLYEDKTPGELFITVSKEGSTISGLLDSFAIQTSMALQRGVPVSEMTAKFTNMRFDPSGPTGNPAIPHATSIVDYIAKWMGQRFSDTTVIDSQSGVTCTNCGGPMIAESGCLMCYTCQESRC